MKPCRILPLLLALLLLAPPAWAETPAQVLPAGARPVSVLPGFDLNTLQRLLAGAETYGLADLDVGMAVEDGYVGTLAEGLLMLRSGRADALSVPYGTALYIAARDEDMRAVPGVLTADLHLLMAPGREAAIGALDAAIDALREGGTLDALYADYVDAAIDGADMPAIALPVIEGADTLVVGVSGDAPPFDYTQPDGTPAGFNTALLAALSERAGINFTLVPLESGARFTALAAGKIDAFFWQIQFAIDNPDVDAGALEAALQLEGDYLLSGSYATVLMGFLVVDE